MNFDLTRLDPIKGFLDPTEASRLYELALEASAMGPCLEIGSYCGKSAAVLGSACRENRGVLFSVDHHTGSEEQQPGQAYFDPDLLDDASERIDTLRFFRQTLRQFDLEDTVVPIVGRSDTVGRVWKTPLALLFIDGSHAYESVLADYEIWSPHIMPSGYLVFHDIFPNPADGGQAPWLVYSKAVESGHYEVFPLFKSLGGMKKKF